jgi:hypothetical protein
MVRLAAPSCSSARTRARCFLASIIVCASPGVGICANCDMIAGVRRILLRAIVVGGASDAGTLPPPPHTHTHTRARARPTRAPEEMLVVSSSAVRAYSGRTTTLAVYESALRVAQEGGAPRALRPPLSSVPLLLRANGSALRRVITPTPVPPALHQHVGSCMCSCRRSALKLAALRHHAPPTSALAPSSMPPPPSGARTAAGSAVTTTSS